MIDLEYTLDKMLREVEFDDSLTFPCRKSQEWRRTGINYLYSLLNNIFRVEYKTPFQNPIVNKLYTKPLRHEKWPITYFMLMNKIAEDNIKIPDHDALAYALENAFYHGEIPINVSMYVGKNGAVYEIKDSGSGFDAAKKVDQFKLWVDGNREEKYFFNGGHGFQAYNNSNITTSFNDDGNTCWIMLNIEKHKKAFQDRIDEIEQKYKKFFLIDKEKHE
jgi:hypothetical protein